MKTLQCSLALSVLLASTAANAEFYLGAGMGVFQTQYEDVDTARAYKAFLGLRGNHPFFAEVSAMSTDEAGIASLNGAALALATMQRVQGIAAYVGLRAPLDDTGSGGLFIKGGYYNSRLRLSNSGARSQETGDGLAYGLGAEWFPVHYLGLRGDIEVYDNVDDRQGNENISFAHLGLVLAIGGNSGQRDYGVKRERNPYRYYWDD